MLTDRVVAWRSGVWKVTQKHLKKAELMPVLQIMDPGSYRVWHFPSFGPRLLAAGSRWRWFSGFVSAQLLWVVPRQSVDLGLGWRYGQLRSWILCGVSIPGKLAQKPTKAGSWRHATGRRRSGFKAWGNDGFPDLSSRTSTRVVVGCADRGMVEIPCGCWQLCVEKHKLVCKARECLVHENGVKLLRL